MCCCGSGSSREARWGAAASSSPVNRSKQCSLLLFFGVVRNRRTDPMDTRRVLYDGTFIGATGGNILIPGGITGDLFCCPESSNETQFDLNERRKLLLCKSLVHLYLIIFGRFHWTQSLLPWWPINNARRSRRLGEKEIHTHSVWRGLIKATNYSANNSGALLLYYRIGPGLSFFAICFCGWGRRATAVGLLNRNESRNQL